MKNEEEEILLSCFIQDGKIKCYNSVERDFTSEEWGLLLVGIAKSVACSLAKMDGTFDQGRWQNEIKEAIDDNFDDPNIIISPG